MVEISSFSQFSTGVVTSPNHPDGYPHNLDKTETIEVESGNLLRLEFNHFDVLSSYTCQGSSCQIVCSEDYVKITDGNGTTLMDKSCGSSFSDPSSLWYFLPPILTTGSNKVEILFHTSIRPNAHSPPGWSLSWSTVTPGAKAPTFLPFPQNVLTFLKAFLIFIGLSRIYLSFLKSETFPQFSHSFPHFPSNLPHFH